MDARDRHKGQRDERTDGRTDGRTDEETRRVSSCVRPSLRWSLTLTEGRPLGHDPNFVVFSYKLYAQNLGILPKL